MPVQMHEKTTTARDGTQSVWKMNMMPATESLEVLAKLSPMLGEPLGALFGDAKIEGEGEGLDANIRTEAIARALAALTKQIAQPGTVDLIKRLLKGLRKNDLLVDFDREFTGNLGVLVKLIAWSLEINYSSFFDESLGLPDMFGKLKALAPTPRTSTGGSGGS